jgi:hypothetical protein
MRIKPDTRKLLEELAKHHYGRALRDYLETAILELKDVTKAKSWDETLGRQLAVKTLEDLFGVISEKKSPVDKSKNQYV